jgi:hypothetical protein
MKNRTRSFRGWRRALAAIVAAVLLSGVTLPTTGWASGSTGTLVTLNGVGDSPEVP